MGISSLVCKLLAAAALALACNSTHPTGNHTSTTAASSSSSSTSSLSHKTIFQFNETGNFLENIVVRQNGDLLFTSFAPTAHLYTLKNPSAAAPQMALVHTFANANGIGGIAKTSAGSSDEEDYVIVAMNFTSFPTPAAGSSTVEGITLDCATGEVLSTRTVARLPEAGLVNGIVTIPGTTGPAVLVSDSANGVVWRVDVATGSYEPAFDETRRRRRAARPSRAASASTASRSAPATCTGRTRAWRRSTGSPSTRQGTRSPAPRWRRSARWPRPRRWMTLRSMPRATSG